MSKTERPEVNKSEPFSDYWYATFGRAYATYPLMSNAEILFALNGDISPYTRYMFLYASYNEALKSVGTLTEPERDLVRTELEEHTKQPEFSGRYWMRVSLLQFFTEVEPRVDITRIIPELSPMMIKKLNELLRLSDEQLAELQSIYEETIRYTYPDRKILWYESLLK